MEMEEGDRSPEVPPSSASLSPPSEAPAPLIGSDLDLDDCVVMSEVHLGCPPNFSGPHISRFSFSLPSEPVHSRYSCAVKAEVTSRHETVNLDEDGDLVLTRRNKQVKESCVVTIQHDITSLIPSVGLQVWRAELLLADFVLHKIFTSSDFDDIVAIELGADRGDEILDNCAKNVRLNSGMFHKNASVYVRELDWMNPWPPKVAESCASHERYDWSPSEVEELESASLLLAADVIYSDDLTDAFFSTLEQLMSRSPGKVLYLALEKRYNFTLNDLNIVANGYIHFRSYITEDEEECDASFENSCFVGKLIDHTQIPQYLTEYQRGLDVEIWQIKFEI